VVAIGDLLAELRSTTIAAKEVISPTSSPSTTT